MEDQQQLKEQEVMVAELTKIKPGVKYNIMVDTPSGGTLITIKSVTLVTQHH